MTLAGYTLRRRVSPINFSEPKYRKTAVKFTAERKNRRQSFKTFNGNATIEG